MIQKRIATLINYINLISCIFLTATTLYYTKVQQIGFYTFFISYFLEFFLDKKWKDFQFDKAKGYFLALLLFFLLIFIYHPFENSNKYFYRLVELRLALFAFSIVGFWGVNKLYRVSYFVTAFVVSSIVAMLYIICGIGIEEFITNPQRANLITQFRIEHINSHIVFNSYLNIALICAWYQIFRIKTKFNALRVIFYVLSGISITYFLVVSEGRVGIAIWILLMFCICIYQLWKIKKLLIIPFILISPIIILTVVSNHKRMSKEKIINDPRVFIWKASIYVIKRQPMIGYGASRAQEEFDASLNKTETKEFKEQWKNTRIMHSHNQFFQTYMEFGIIGIALLLGLIIGPIILTESNRRVFSFLLILAFVSQFMTDIVITYQGFPAIFGILTIITIAIKKEPLHSEKTKLDI